MRQTYSMVLALLARIGQRRQRGARLARGVITFALFGALLSACGGSGSMPPHATSSSTAAPTTRTTTTPGASPPGGATARGAGINVEPSYRPWRYTGGPAPESWWCQPPNCSPNTSPQTRIDTDLRLASQLGVNLVRVEFPWRFIETGTGVYDWSRADLIVQEAQTYHVALQPVVVWSPAWVGAPTAAPSPGAFQAFMNALVGRYHASIHYWEMWNEPDLSKYWDAGERAYVSDILIPGYQGAKAADPSAQVILGGPSWASQDWMNRIYDYGGGDSFDIMAWHAYGDVSTVLSSVDNVLPILSDHHQLNKPLWVGEYGLQEGSPSSADQSALLTGVLTAHSAIAEAQWYNLRDEDAMSCCPPKVEVSGSYGLVENDGVTFKAGFATLQRLIRAGLPTVAPAQ